MAKKKATKKPVNKKASIEKSPTKQGSVKSTSPAAFSIPSTSGQDFSLKDFKGKKVVLYFYPKDSTPGCTVEGLEFSKLAKEFKKLNTEVFGISRDSLKSHENFKSKQNFEIHLLSDPEEKACKIFDVIKEKNMYGRKVLGIERSTFLIDEDGQIAQEWRKVKAPGHAQEVLEAVRSSIKLRNEK